jgi:integrase
VRVQYRLDNSQQLFFAPTPLTAWLVGHDKEFVQKEIEGWKSRVNQVRGDLEYLLPEFFKKQESKFIRFAGRNADSATVEAYYRDLGLFVFPFFVGKLRESDVSKWSDSYPQFREFLLEHFGSPSSVNRVLTALRRYLKFLTYSGKYKVLHSIQNEPIARDQRGGKVLPGTLPFWEDVAKYLKSIAPSYQRWCLIISAAFGTRVSESTMAELVHLIGKNDLAVMEKTNDVVAKLNSKYKPLAFLSVIGAEKVKIVNKRVLAILGESDDDPKTGPYTAVCVSKDLAKMIMDAIAAGEHLKPDKFTKNMAGTFMSTLPADESPYRFDKYTFHDFRRLHITLLTLEWSDFWDVAQAHGHKGIKQTQDYFQWGLMQRRRASATLFELNV